MGHTDNFLRAHYNFEAAAEALSVQVERAEQTLFNMIHDAVREGNDNRIPLSYGGHTSRSYPISAFLGDCGEEARLLLFAACHLAEKDGHPNTVAERNAAAAHMLRKFVERVATDYAKDNAEFFVGDDE